MLQRRQTPFSLLAIFFVFLTFVFSPALFKLLLFWLDSEEYGHGLLIMGLAVFTFIQRRDFISRIDSKPSVLGSGLLIFAMLLYAASIFADIQMGKYYAFIVALFGWVLVVGGFVLLRPMLFPLSLVFLSIPLPYLVTRILTQKLQLLSSDLGVYLIRLMGLPVLQNGNVIDMGSFVMLVEEACSGLRYLLPLMGIGWIAAYSYRGNYATRAIIFASTIPITVLMNSARIAVTGLLIKYVGSDAAEGFIHDFEGWIVFLCACIFFYLFIELITWITKGKPGASKHFILHHTRHSNNPVKHVLWAGRHFAHMVVVTILAAIIYSASYLRPSEPIERLSFNDFPLRIDDMEFFPDVLSPEVLNVLKADDYFIGDFIRRSKAPINLYMAYYAKQKEGSVIHSPKDCLPSAGWVIETQSIVDLEPLGMEGSAVRSVIERGGERLMVFYWVNQQSSNYSNELAARSALLWRALVYSRTDGTLVRVYTEIEQGEYEAEQRLRKFIQALNGEFPHYLPQ